ncbi:MAG: hypothetical protein HC771_07770 [Synechococcales cyanobacterium CRU_2_2]|nr:hypothetical protein [Synechococcales cyanobacterium CRU_2_2]
MTQGLSFQKPATAPDRQLCAGAIAQLLTQAQCDLQLTDSIAQSFEVAPMTLGDILADRVGLDQVNVDQGNIGQVRSSDPRTGRAASGSASQEYILLVLQGRVRVLAHAGVNHAGEPDFSSWREYSAQVVEAGAAFGELEQWGTDQPYRAVAASDGWVARIAWSRLKPLLKQLPSLHRLLCREARQRDDLIFLRTQVFGDDRAIASYQLQLLLGLLTPIEVEKGTAIARPTRI